MHEIERLRHIERQPVAQAEVVQPTENTHCDGARSKVPVLAASAFCVLLAIAGVALGLVGSKKWYRS